VHAAEKLLHEKASDAGAGVDGGQNEERLEHDGEVVPVREQRAHTRQAAEDARHAHRQRHAAAGSSCDHLAGAARERR
jgi:hypothetical protein